MKTSLSIVSLVAISALTGCGSDSNGSTPAGEAGDAGRAGSSNPTAGTGGGGEAGAPSEAGGGTAGGSAGGMMMGDAGAAGAGEEPQQYYACQGSTQQFVRRAIQGVLGRRPYSQAEVNLYSELISKVDQLDGVEPEALPAEPGKPLRHSRQVVMQALFQSPEYATNWEELYRDFMRVQRVDEYQNAACYGNKVRTDAVDVAKFVRDNSAETTTGDGGVAPTMGDVIAGSLALDDISPMYTANLFGMVVKTYSGANGTAVESELGRRRDFGAWFDAVYLNRDPVCLNCHNSEFSVTQWVRLLSSVSVTRPRSFGVLPGARGRTSSRPSRRWSGALAT